MAKETKTKTEKTKEVKEVKASKTATNWDGMSLKDLKAELEKLTMDIKLGKEQNSSLAKRLKKQIAREMTKLNLNKQN